MPDIQKISIALPVEQLTALKAAVATGEYATTSEVVREALYDWQHKRELRDKEMKHLRKLWDDGKASGPAAPLDFSELRREAQERIKQTASQSLHAG